LRCSLCAIACSRQSYVIEYDHVELAVCLIVPPCTFLERRPREIFSTACGQRVGMMARATASQDDAGAAHMPLPLPKVLTLDQLRLGRIMFLWIEYGIVEPDCSSTEIDPRIRARPSELVLLAHPLLGKIEVEKGFIPPDRIPVLQSPRTPAGRSDLRSRI